MSRKNDENQDNCDLWDLLLFGEKQLLRSILAQAFNGEIISGDSQQVYRKLDIGTAKATPEEQAAAPHHLIDVREVTESYSAFDFVREAKIAIEEITARGKLPIIAGGTGLYIQSLLEGYHLGGEVPHEEILAYRAQLDLLSDEDLYRRGDGARACDSSAQSSSGHAGS